MQPPDFCISYFLLLTLVEKKVFASYQTLLPKLFFLVVACQWFSWRLREFSTADEGFLQQFTDQIFTNHNAAVKRSLALMLPVWQYLIMQNKTIPSSLQSPTPILSSCLFKKKMVPHQTWCTAEKLVTECTKRIFFPPHPCLHCLFPWTFPGPRGAVENHTEDKTPTINSVNSNSLNSNVSDADWTLLSYSFWN